jgi:RimJ/RimL family protein N-acetyltransferase
VRRYTRVPTNPAPDFVTTWLRSYLEGGHEGTRLGFAIESHEGEFLGIGLFVRIDREARQGEIGYIVGVTARGRGVATRTVRLLTEWGFADLRLERIELWIDTANGASEGVAARAGYRREGVLRSVWFKEDLRSDFGVWSRLRGEAGV